MYNKNHDKRRYAKNKEMNYFFYKVMLTCIRDFANKLENTIKIVIRRNRIYSNANR